MNRRGVCYDVGAVMFPDWRPDFDPRIVPQELQIIRDDLHCNAVRVTGGDLRRLEIAARAALSIGLEVWLSPPKAAFRAVAEFYASEISD